MARASLFALLLAVGCYDRMLPARECADGHVVAGEVCFADAHDFLRVPFTPVALRVAEFDGDGLPDVLVTGVDTAGAVVAALARNTPGGVLAAPGAAAVFGCSAHPALGDADGDGATDLLVDACDDTMLVFVADGAGSFAAPVLVDLDVATRTSTLVDVDLDGITDVVALGFVEPSVALVWARGDGLGGFAPPLGTFVGTLGAPDEPLGFSLGQLDGDGPLDAVLVHADASAPPLLAKGGPAGFAAPVPWDELPATIGVAVLDVDGGGESELLVVRSDPAAFEVWRGTQGGLRRVATTALGTAAERLITAGDVDGDGAIDLGFFDPDSPRVALWLNDGDGRWAPSAEVDVGAPIDQLAMVDLDDDGAAELIAGTFAAGGVTVVRADP